MSDAAYSAGATTKPPFDRCPRCDYSLRGLPANHACPECGLNYDSRSVVYCPKDPRRALIASLFVVPMSGIFLTRTILDSLRTGRFLTWNSVGCVVWVIAMSWLIAAAIRQYRKGYLVAVTPEVLIVRLAGELEREIRCRDVESAEVVEHSGKRHWEVWIRLLGRKRRLKLGSETQLFTRRHWAERFAEHVNERAVAARAGSAANSEEGDMA